MSPKPAIAVGTDTRHDTSDCAVAHLEAQGYRVIRLGAIEDGEPLDWVQVGEQAARMVAQGAVESAVVCCWTGTGVSIAANKVPGIRAALCPDPATARGARRWNDANVLAIGVAGTDPDTVRTILDAWFDVNGPDSDEVRTISQLDELEERYRARAATAR